MIPRFLCWSAASVLACGLAGAPAWAAAAKPDLSGVWVLEGATIDVQDPTITGMAGRLGAGSGAGVPKGANSWRPPPPKLKGAYAERAAELARLAAQGKAVEDPSALCIAQGMPRFWFGPYAWEIVQGAKQIHMFQEWNDQSRRIYLDGRKHPSPDDADPSYNGHSIGHWEGDTLVVDTTNLVSDTLVWSNGETHSDAMHIVERIRLAGPDTLDVKVTVEDPKAFQEPWTFSRQLHRKAIEIQEFNCNANNRHTLDADGAVQLVLKPQ